MQLLRRSDQTSTDVMGRSMLARIRQAPLPEPVYRDFIDMLFSMRLPVIGMGLVFTLVAAMLARQWHDGFMGTLALCGGVVTAARIGLIRFYFRRHPIERLVEMKRWERAYAWGNYLFAGLLAVMNLHLAGHNEPLAQLISVSLVFSFCAGVVARISVRPFICGVSVLLASLPTVVALALEAFEARGFGLWAQLYAVEAVLILMIAALGLQTVAYLYRAAVQHHTSRHDLARMAKHDALTGLANRLLLREEFRRKSKSSLRQGARMALHFVDLDGFKAINDVHGHPAGDFVLQQVAKRLRTTVREGDVIARLGGDEFVILQAQVADRSETELLGRRIVKRISEPYSFQDKELRISASVGIAMAPDCGDELERLLSAADVALYRAKAAGKRTVVFATAQSAAKPWLIRQKTSASS
jgi:diguanylate cyclase